MMKAIVGITIMVSIAISSIAGLIYLEKIDVEAVASQLASSEKVKQLESEIKVLSSRISVLYGDKPTPVLTNEIMLPDIELTWNYCDLRFNCVQPYVIEVSVGDTVTWKNEFSQQLRVTHATNYNQSKCGSTSSLISLQISPNQIGTKQFDEAGEYVYCVQGYPSSNEIHGIIIVKESSGLL